ncbi:MAG: peptide deformylase [Candidatus Aureabacteria bacterium]|nr:peptide deformylase [Candidatus Auribacterota bacterium]
MSILDIKKYPEEVLLHKSEFVKEIKKQEKKLFDDMVETMISANGLGLAAPQIGESCQIFVVGLEDRIIKIANPKIIDVIGRETMPEGCLSIPDYSADIERFYGVVVQGVNEEGELIKIEAKGLLARIFQHEIDHLNGKLIINHKI